MITTKLVCNSISMYNVSTSIGPYSSILIEPTVYMPSEVSEESGSWFESKCSFVSKKINIFKKICVNKTRR